MAEIITQIIEQRQELGVSQRDLEKMTGIKQEALQGLKP